MLKISLYFCHSHSSIPKQITHNFAFLPVCCSGFYYESTKALQQQTEKNWTGIGRITLLSFDTVAVLFKFFFCWWFRCGFRTDRKSIVLLIFGRFSFAIFTKINLVRYRLKPTKHTQREKERETYSRHDKIQIYSVYFFYFFGFRTRTVNMKWNREENNIHFSFFLFSFCPSCLHVFRNQIMHQFLGLSASQANKQDEKMEISVSSIWKTVFCAYA